MTKGVFIVILSLFSFSMKAQVVFKTLVPQHPVISGESFQVQYVIEGAEKPGSFRVPLFGNFRTVAGPNIYIGSVSSGKGRISLRNTVYTLAAQKPGMFIIPGANITINGKSMRSNDATVEVIGQEEAARRFSKEADVGGSAYFLKPGEDAYEKIRQNLFLKVMVDKNSCFVGEPVLATFKLYSRLESRSDIVKNPGFYGFTVYDMVNLSDKKVATENINGASFDVHTIRKVQLYPLQPGIFKIDAMQIKNNVEFSRSVVNQKAEQEISEGILNNNDPGTRDENTETFESDISSAPVEINVKPTPVKNKPPGYNGAAGEFTITARVIKNKLVKYEEGIFEILISGRGNFIQLNAPAVRWPAGIEGFEPVVKDSLDKTVSPLAGARIFRYSFASANPGVYSIPPVSFSFFNSAGRRYNTIITQALQVNISSSNQVVPAGSNQRIVKNTGGGSNYWMVGGGILLLSLGGMAWVLRSRKLRSRSLVTESTGAKQYLSVEETLAAVYLLEYASDDIFYTSLYQAVWNFYGAHFHLSGSEMNKENLFARMKARQVPQNLIEETRQILQESETGIYTGISIGKDKGQLLERAKQVLQKISGR